MKRTQIYLPEDLHETVRRMAFEQRRSMADVIREAVASYVSEQEVETAFSTADQVPTTSSSGRVPA